MLTVKNLSKCYSNNFWAVKNLDLAVNSNEIFCIAGPNGSGKTTIINCVLGIIPHNTGEILLDGNRNNTVAFKHSIAYVPDELLLIEALTGKEYLSFVNSMYNNDNPVRLKNLIELFGMQDSLNQPIETFSHGMKKKTQLIAAFMLDCKLMILDEPFSGLDVEAIIVTKKIMNKFLSKGGSILLSTHDLLAVEKLGNRVAILNKGEKITEGSANSLMKDHGCNNLEDVFIKVSMSKNRSERIEEIIHNF